MLQLDIAQYNGAYFQWLRGCDCSNRDDFRSTAASLTGHMLDATGSALGQW